jgi:hypothetical protein
VPRRAPYQPLVRENDSLGYNPKKLTRARGTLGAPPLSPLLSLLPTALLYTNIALHHAIYGMIIWFLRYQKQRTRSQHRQGTRDTGQIVVPHIVAVPIKLTCLDENVAEM